MFVLWTSSLPSRMWLNGRRLAGRLTWTEPLVAVVLRAAVVLTYLDRAARRCSPARRSRACRHTGTATGCSAGCRTGRTASRCSCAPLFNKTSCNVCRESWQQLAYMYNTGRLQQLTSPWYVARRAVNLRQKCSSE